MSKFIDILAYLVSQTDLQSISLRIVRPLGSFSYRFREDFYEMDCGDTDKVRNYVREANHFIDSLGSVCFKLLKNRLYERYKKVYGFLADCTFHLQELVLDSKVRVINKVWFDEDIYPWEKIKEEKPFVDREFLQNFTRAANKRISPLDHVKFPGFEKEKQFLIVFKSYAHAMHSMMYRKGGVYQIDHNLVSREGLKDIFRYRILNVVMDYLRNVKLEGDDIFDFEYYKYLLLASPEKTVLLRNRIQDIELPLRLEVCLGDYHELHMG